MPLIAIYLSFYHGKPFASRSFAYTVLRSNGSRLLQNKIGGLVWSASLSWL